MVGSKERDWEYLLDILNSAKIALSYVQSKDYSDFAKDMQCQDAVIRRLEIIGEATRRISDKMKSEFAEIPWNDMAGMRNFLIHEYGEVDLTIIWDTMYVDIPPLVNILERLLSRPK